MATTEGRFSDKKDDGEKLMSVWKEDGVPSEGMNAETVKRYLHLARRLSSGNIKEQLMAWEMYEKRSTLVDSMTALRAVFAVSSDSADPNLFISLTIILLVPSCLAISDRPIPFLMNHIRRKIYVHLHQCIINCLIQKLL